MSTFLVVASIDFGTTYSGWAYSFRHEFEENPAKVNAKTWHGGNFVSLKGPTCVLIKPDGKTIEAFGYDAETQYADLAAENKHKEWYYFRRFKMKLFDKETLTMSLEIEDEDGKRLKASTVFSLSIRYLKDDLMKTSSDKLSGDITHKDIHWVITVPAIWSEPAKKFMREAAREAGIPFGQLSICLEPEAASIYCRHLLMEKSSDTSVSTFKPGTKYLVLDAGGGTVDITVHEITQEGKLKELLQASGGAWGGTKVDDAFLELFNKIAGVNIIERLKSENMEDYLELIRNFEVKKRDIIDKPGITVIRIPISLMELAEEMTGKSLKQLLQNSPYKESIRQDKDKLKFDTSVLVSIFNTTIENIVGHVGTLFQKTATGCQTVLMVGGFSDSKLLQDKVKVAFNKKTLIVPPDAGLAVLKGAVVFGHNRREIVSRIARYSYGLSACVKFEPKSHPEEKLIIVEGKPKCKGCFSTLVRKYETVDMETACKQKGFSPLRPFSYFDANLYCSSKEYPQYVDEEGCHHIGRFKVNCRDKFGNIGSANLSLLFGGTEVEARAVLQSTLEEATATFDLPD
ncbi:heat shock 70 kDa protein 12A-like [Mya arenaria]|nr:heat shock 70 kDa protein 12A-like [Mya arenaria]XP_052761128.1 heat shock 70 kDa protein 12A-like [Mya arenaria]XP_052761129.1 heat shock 70 kDa protein 12A-like [Mya arenaria]